MQYFGRYLVGIGVSETFISDLGVEQSPAKSIMSDGNKNRNWQVFERLFNDLLKYYGSSLAKYANQIVIEEVKSHTVLIRDSSTISLCLNMFDWAKFRTAKGGIKIHTQGWCERAARSNVKYFFVQVRCPHPYFNT
jgi:hypothetical protein